MRIVQTAIRDSLTQSGIQTLEGRNKGLCPEKNLFFSTQYNPPFFQKESFFYWKGNIFQRQNKGRRSDPIFFFFRRKILFTRWKSQENNSRIILFFLSEGKYFLKDGGAKGSAPAGSSHAMPSTSLQGRAVMLSWLSISW